jgi:hypothetical protein
LSALDVLIKEADRLDSFTLENAQVNRFGFSRGATHVQPSSAESHARSVGTRNGLLERRLSLSVHNPAHVVGVGVENRLHGDARVIDRKHRVGINANDDGLRGVANREIESGRRRSFGVVDHRDALVSLTQRVDQIVGAVDARPHRNGDVPISGKVLRQQTVDRAGDVRHIVEDGHHVRDSRQ